MNAQPEIIEAENLPVPLAPLPVVSPLTMLDRAIERGVSPDILKGLMDLQERHERNHARRAFDAAMSAAKAEIPIVITNRVGHNNKRYADFAAFAAAIDPILAKHGLSYRFRTNQDECIHVTCIIAHRDGHSEETSLAAGADVTGNKNAIQAIGSTLTYLQRYSLRQALGLAASDDDDGRAAGAGEAVTSEQENTLRLAIVETGADLPKFLRFFKIERLDELSAARFDDALKMLQRKASEAAKPKAEVPA